MESAVKDWIKADETAKEMLTRLFTERPFLPLPPPLHKLPLRPGNVVEVAGPPSSGKTHILMQAAISCILPKQWKGVQFGGMERLAVFVDLDCRFDVLRFSRLLKHKLIQANSNDMKSQTQYDKELFAECMRRFLYIRCYNSLEFLATLKTMNKQLQKQKDIQGVGVHLLVLDSIGAFYWMDRALPSLLVGGSNRKSLSLQIVMENVVQDLQKLLLVHPLLVLATKNSISGDKSTADELMRNTSSGPRPKHREYMPSVWQSTTATIKDNTLT
ncbi:DNA repair protein XRCC2 homolog isoform X3 [Coffea arabica]|uniref:DNA repair protein XRCC2 homolog isoform X3 n=1 Tax=Coffea arabica TaxID=13443 RepID=A0ABM4UGV5_COFAR